MSSEWLSMIFKNKKSVFVNKKSWKSQSNRVKFKYDSGSSSKVYEGLRCNFSLSKSPKTSKTSSQNDDNQKIKDFLMIATHCDKKMATNLLRNAKWDVQNALEFYFKHQSHINTSSNTNNNKSNTNSKQTKAAPIKYGKAGTRTQQQKQLVKEKFDELYTSFADHEIICFTDGACRGNPGPAGSGCVVLYGKKYKDRFIQKSLALGHHTNNIAELYAIGLALHIIKHHPSSGGWIRKLCTDNNRKYIRIISDSRYSIGVLSQGWKAKKNVELIKWIRRNLDMITSDGFVVSFHWVGGHSGVEYNEMADDLATQGVKGSKNGKVVDVTKPPTLFESNYNHHDTAMKRGKKRKYNEIGEGTDCNNSKDILKRRRLNDNINVNDRKYDHEDSTPPQSPTIT